MAQVYNTAKALGRTRKVEEIIARHHDTQAELDRVAHKAALKARSKLRQHRNEGDSEILVERGRIDRYVILSDMRGLKAAMTIEYGRHREKNSHGQQQSQSEGLFILHDAFGMTPPRR